ncbi:MAG: RNA methyltransferase [Pseudomonadota bacterium]
MAAESRNLLSNIRIVLCRPRHPGNIGAAARAMKTMGLSQLYLVSPKKFPHPDAEALASGAVDVLEQARVCDSLEAALAGCVLAIGTSTRQRDLQTALLTPHEAARQALAEGQAGDVAFVFGNETFGLSKEELARCQALMTIPANPEYSSLNLGAAVQVMTYELRRSALSESFAQPELDAADLAEVERFYAHLEKTLIEIGFLDPASPKRLMPKLRRLFSRTRLQKEEINILRGLLSAVESRKHVRVK